MFFGNQHSDGLCVVDLRFGLMERVVACVCCRVDSVIDACPPARSGIRSADVCQPGTVSTWCCVESGIYH